jgi:hypothetical protein
VIPWTKPRSAPAPRPKSTVCDLSGDLLHVSEPLPGKTHDAKAFDDLGLTDTLRADNSIGDKGFIGTGPTVAVQPE